LLLSHGGNWVSRASRPQRNAKLAGALPPPPMDGVALGRYREIAATVDDMGAQASAAWESSLSSPSYMMSLPLLSHFPSSHLPLSTLSPPSLPPFFPSISSTQTWSIDPCLQQQPPAALPQTNLGWSHVSEGCGEGGGVFCDPFTSFPRNPGLVYSRGTRPLAEVPTTPRRFAASPCLLHFLLTFLPHRTTCLSASL
jgi:hypothetical protein